MLRMLARLIGDADRAENQQAAFPVLDHVGCGNHSEALALIRCGGLEYDSGSQKIMSA